jgi:hypothetical protein
MQAFCDKIGNWCNEIVSWTPGDNDMYVAEPHPEHMYGVTPASSSSSSPSEFAAAAPYIPAALASALDDNSDKPKSLATEPRRVRLRDRLLGK